MDNSEQLNEIFAALAKAQTVIQNPEKNAKNSHYGSKYTTLDVGLTAVREALSAHGIAVFQRTYMEDRLLMVKTILGHSSGQWLSSDYPVVMFPVKQQDAVAALTYARRASLFAAAGIAGEDDDGNSVAKLEINPGVLSTEESYAMRERMLEELGNVSDLKGLAAWSAKNGKNKPKLISVDADRVTEDFEKLKKSLKEANNG